MPARPLLSCLLCLMLCACGDAEETHQESSTGAEAPGEDGAGAGEDDDGWDDDWGDDPVVESHANARETLGIHPPPTPWAEMSHEDRDLYMIGTILPIMKEMFAEHNARFAGFECSNCHGSNMRDVNFAMPTPSLFPVPAAGTPAYENMRAMFGELVTFMEEEVTPTMGTLMGEESYTCQHCHPGA